jgi:hypothetical protein
MKAYPSFLFHISVQCLLRPQNMFHTFLSACITTKRGFSPPCISEYPHFVARSLLCGAAQNLDETASFAVVQEPEKIIAPLPKQIRHKFRLTGNKDIY